jgi:hypothetical protein
VIPRTFSLARLLLAVTVFCLLCGLAVKSRDLAILIGPSLMVWIVLFMIAPSPVWVTLACVGGVVCSSLIFTPARWSPVSDLTYFMQTSFPWASFAAIFGGAAILDDIRARRLIPPDQPFAQPTKSSAPSTPDSSLPPQGPDSHAAIANPKSQM